MVQLSILEKRGVRAIMKEEMLWTAFVWCMAHRLELAIQDALKDKFSDKVDDMILRIFYLYQKSPQKTQGIKGKQTNISDYLTKHFSLS